MTYTWWRYIIKEAIFSRIFKKSRARLVPVRMSSLDQDKKYANNNPKSFKNILFDMFLKYQFNVCVEPKPPLTHLISLSLLTSIWGSYRYIILYWFSIIFSLLNIYLSEKFPNAFGKRYVSFLKKHSSKEAFDMYYGNPGSVIKTFLANPEWLKIAFKNGASKGIGITATAFVVEHSFHHAKIGQLYEYHTEKFLNNGLHSTGKPFSFQPNGPLLIDSFLGRSPKE